MRWVPKWLVWLVGDDRNLFHPAPMPVLKCVACNRFVTFKAKAKDEIIHIDDSSPICEPIGVYRA